MASSRFLLFFVKLLAMQTDSYGKDTRVFLAASALYQSVFIIRFDLCHDSLIKRYCKLLVYRSGSGSKNAF